MTPKEPVPIMSSGSYSERKEDMAEGVRPLWRWSSSWSLSAECGWTLASVSLALVWRSRVCGSSPVTASLNAHTFLNERCVLLRQVSVFVCFCDMRVARRWNVGTATRTRRNAARGRACARPVTFNYFQCFLGRCIRRAGPSAAAWRASWLQAVAAGHGRRPSRRALSLLLAGLLTLLPVQHHLQATDPSLPHSPAVSRPRCDTARRPRPPAPRGTPHVRSRRPCARQRARPSGGGCSTLWHVGPGPAIEPLGFCKQIMLSSALPPPPNRSHRGIWT